MKQIKNKGMEKKIDKYDKVIPRVTEIISFFYPFEGDKRDFYIKRLRKNNIKEIEYNYIATSYGTEIHKVAEEVFNGNRISKKSLNNIPIITQEKLQIKEWAEDLLNKYPEAVTESEVYCLEKDNKFQGTADLVRIDTKNNTVYLYDIKSFDIAKKHFGLKQNNKLTKEKLDKTALQLSFYLHTYIQRGYKVGGIYLVWVHSSGLKEVELEVQTDIEELLGQFYKAKENILINNQVKIMEKTDNNKPIITIGKGLKVRLSSPPRSYWTTEVTLDLGQIEGLTPEEALNEAVLIHQRLHNLYSE